MNGLTQRYLPLFLLFTLACNLFSPPTATPAPTTPAPRPTATAAPTRAPSPTETLPPSATPEAAHHLRPEDVIFHPEPQLYSGDVVSLEISAANAAPEWREATVSVYLGAREGQPIATTQFGKFGIGERAQATFRWVWDTAGLAGPQTLVIAVEPKDASGPEAAPLDTLSLAVNLLPADQRPMPEPLAHWTQAESACCVFHYLTGTAAARDIDLIRAEADRAFARVEQTLEVEQKDKVTFTLLSRLLGHGGFASEEISVTYIDRDPASGNLSNVFTHESTHLLDAQIAQTKPTIMTEGLAVYVAGGHFKPENLDRRAAALLTLGRYLPLKDLADNFYPSQHEIGYLEGGAFIAFLVETYGWQRFRAFYGSFQEAPTDAQMLNTALHLNFDKGLSELEADWLAHLRALPVDEDEAEDLRLTIDLYDGLRRYQQIYDPSAYFLTAWLPDGPEARQRNIVADFVRHPRALENVTLEIMLAEAGRALEAGDYETGETLLTSINAALGARDPRADPLAAEYAQIAARVSAAGFEAQAIALDGDTALVTAIRDWPTLDALTLIRTASGWNLAAQDTNTTLTAFGSIISAFLDH
jgi:hypothetical protein